MTCDVIIQNNNFVSEIIISESGNNADFRETEFFNMLVNNNVRQRFLNTGVLPFHFDVPKGTSHIRLKAVLSKNGETIEKEIEIKKKYSTNNEFIKLWSTSDDVMVGDYAVFHISSNFTFEVFYILVSTYNNPYMYQNIMYQKCNYYSLFSIDLVKRNGAEDSRGKSYNKYIIGIHFLRTGI